MATTTQDTQKKTDKKRGIVLDVGQLTITKVLKLVKNVIIGKGKNNLPIKNMSANLFGLALSNDELETMESFSFDSDEDLGDLGEEADLGEENEDLEELPTDDDLDDLDEETDDLGDSQEQ